MTGPGGSKLDVESRPAGLTVPEAVVRYGKMAGSYDVWGNLFEEKAQARALELASVADGTRILEVAVGTGSNFQRLLNANSHGLTVGVDAAPEMLTRARQRLEKEQPDRKVLALADCRHLPFKGDSFDLLFSAYLLDLLSIDDMRATVAEFRRVLRPGGRLALVSMTHGGSLCRIWNWLYAVQPSLLGGCRSISSLPLVEAEDFAEPRREIVSQWGFVSEVVTALAR